MRMVMNNLDPEVGERPQDLVAYGGAGKAPRICWLGYGERDRLGVLVNHMVKSGQVESERIFILEPKSLAPQQKEKLRDCRAELRIK